MYFDKFMNIGSNQNASLMKAVLFMYLMVVAPFSLNLLSGKSIEFLRTNRLAHLLIGYMMMLVIIKMTTNVSTNEAVLYSAIAYAWFILSTKMDLTINIAIVSLLIVGYFYESITGDVENVINADETQDDVALDKARRKHIQMRTFIGLSILGLTAYGVFCYFNKKTMQYGDSFDVETFVFGPSTTTQYFLTK
jgi:hypothetical protein